MGLVEEILGVLTVKSVLLVAVVAYIVYSIACRIDERIRFKRIGALRAPFYKSKIPGGFDLIYRTIKSAAEHKNRENWEAIFRDVGCHTAEFRILGLNVIFTDEPENIKAILATQFQDYGKGKPFHDEFSPFLGDSIFTTDGSQWHASRQLLRPQFIKDRVSDLDTFEEHLVPLFAAMAVGGDAAAAASALAAQKAGRTMPSTYSANGRIIDISDLFFRYTLDVACDFLLGKNTHSLTTPGEEFALAFNEVQRVQGVISRTGPANGIIPRGSYNRGLRVIDNFVQPFIDRALMLPVHELEKNTRESADGGSGRYTFLHALAQFTRDRKVLRDQLMAVLIAGRDTTACTLSWAIYELGRNAECVRKLRAEIAENVGLEGDANCRRPTYADLKSMKYLQHVINEALRMYPAVPYNVRRALHDTTLPRGGGPDGMQPVCVLKDTPIGYSALLMHRRADLYPAHLPHPDVFCPERWDHWQPKPWHFIPFNGGPRICIGQNFAMTEMGYMLVRLFQKFERVESHMHAIDGGKPTLRADIVLMPGDGVKVAFYEPVKA